MQITTEVRQKLVNRLLDNGLEVTFAWDGIFDAHGQMQKIWTCIEWQGSLNEAGYGSVGIPFALTGGKRQTTRVHRLMWMLFNGPIPEDMVIHHTCNNRRCFNLEHLQLATQSENNAEMIKRKADIAANPDLGRRFILSKERVYLCSKTRRRVSREIRIWKLEQ